MKPRDRNLCPRCDVSKGHAPGCDGKSPNERRLQTQLAPKCACGSTATSGYADCGACRERRTEREDRACQFARLRESAITATSLAELSAVVVALITHVEENT